MSMSLPLAVLFTMLLDVLESFVGDLCELDGTESPRNVVRRLASSQNTYKAAQDRLRMGCCDQNWSKKHMYLCRYIIVS